MGLILDSSIVIAAERNGDTIERLIERIIHETGQQDAALSAVGLTEIGHGIYRANTPERRARRELFIATLLRVVVVYPYTQSTALLAARIGGEQESRGIKIPFPDLMIGATALELHVAVLTFNPRHFRMIPGLEVLQLPA